MSQLSEISDLRCGKKKWYHSLKLAEIVAEERSLATGEWIIAYECVDCGRFHIGHASPTDYALAMEQEKRTEPGLKSKLRRMKDLKKGKITEDASPENL